MPHDFTAVAVDLPTPKLFELPKIITQHEWDTAQSAPPCVVENLIWQDLGLISAGGGTGKSTIQIYEAICIILAIPLYGRKILRPGPVMYLTAEDPRHILVARARKICQAMDLTDEQTTQVREQLLIKDLTSEIFRLTEISHDVVEISINTQHLIDAIQAQAKTDPITLLILDPLISFGTGEGRINDSEQGIIMACRRIIAITSVAIQLIHHVSQLSSRERLTDAYAARGGTALPDGCRFVRILHNIDPDDQTIPASLNGPQFIQMHIPKTTYAKPQPIIWLSRDEYAFQWAIADPPRTPSDVAASQQEQVLTFIKHNLTTTPPSQFSKETLISQRRELNMNRIEIRAAIDALLARNALVKKDANRGEKRGGAMYFLFASDTMPRQAPPSPAGEHGF